MLRSQLNSTQTILVSRADTVDVFKGLSLQGDMDPLLLQNTT